MRDVPLYFIDYSFNLNKNNDIEFDPDMKPHMLQVNEGDEFKVKFIDGKIVLERK